MAITFESGARPAASAGVPGTTSTMAAPSSLRRYSERIVEVGGLRGRGFALLHRRGLGIEDQAPTAGGQSFERRARPHSIEPIGPEAAPVVGHHGIERLDHVVEIIGNHLRSRARRAIEEPAEIIEALGAVRRGADQGVRLQPQHRGFNIEIRGARSLAPSRRLGVAELRGDGRVGERAPIAPLARLQPGRRLGP